MDHGFLRCTVDNSMRVRPSLWQCLWAVPFFLIGVGFFVYTLFHGLKHVTDSLTQVVVPGRQELSLKSVDTYTVFLEEQSVVNGRIYSEAQSIEGLMCRVNSARSGASIKVGEPSTNTSYELSGRSGHSVLEFRVPEDGTYLFACDYGAASKGPDVVVAVGSGVGSAISHMIVGSFAAFFGSCAASTIVVLAVLLMRQRNKKRILQSGPAQV